MLFSECKKVNANSHLIDSAEEIDSSLLAGANSIGVCGAHFHPQMADGRNFRSHKVKT